MSNKTQNILFTAISLITGLGTIATGLVVTYAGGLGLRGLIKKDYAFEYIPDAKVETQTDTTTENH